MEKGYIASASGIKARDKIGCAMGDLASCLVFLLLRFVYPLSRQKIEELRLEKEKVLGAAKEAPHFYTSFPQRGKVASADLPQGGCRMRENKNTASLPKKHKSNGRIRIFVSVRCFFVSFSARFSS